MAKLTQAQAEKWDKQLSGGFHFDIQRFVLRGEKVARRDIKMENGKILRATLDYQEVRNGYRYTGQVQPIIHFQIWESGNTVGMMVSHGLGAYVKVGTVQDKKLWSELCKLSSSFDDDKLLALAGEHMEQLKNPSLMPVGVSV